MKIFCQSVGCASFIELNSGVTLATKYACRLHTRKAPDTIRFQQFQFDEDQLGSGTDPRVYERARQSKKRIEFPRSGRPRKDTQKKLETELVGHQNAAEIRLVLENETHKSGPLGGPDRE